MERSFSYESQKAFEQTTKVIRDTNENLLEETQSTTKGIEELNDLNLYTKVL